MALVSNLGNPSGRSAIALQRCSILLIFFQTISPVSALTQVGFYTNANCLGVPDLINGNNSGVCTPVPHYESYGSFMITSLDPDCAVTVYGVDAEYCDPSDRAVAEVSTCHSSLSVLTGNAIDQLTVDCGGGDDGSNNSSAGTSKSSPSVASPSLPSTASTSTTNSADSNGDHKTDSSSRTIGLTVGLGVPGLALTALGTYFAWRAHKFKKEERNEQHRQRARQRSVKMEDLSGS